MRSIFKLGCQVHKRWKEVKGLTRLIAQVLVDVVRRQSALQVARIRCLHSQYVLSMNCVYSVG
jgi:hypothetical protein